MKPNIHPVMNEVTAHCQCGFEFQTRSTKKEMRVEICAECHPFYTGRQREMKVAGRVERFNKKYAKAVAPVAEVPADVSSEAPAAEVPAE
jgi:large subunit ribosomal protein L31